MKKTGKRLTLDELMRSSTIKRVPQMVLLEPAICHIMGWKPRSKEMQNPIKSTSESITQERKPDEELSSKIVKPRYIRGPFLEVLVENANRVTMEEAIARAEKERRVIASNKRLDQALVGSDEWKSIQSAFWCWSGTMTAYEEVGKPFGGVVEYTDNETGLKYFFEVPKKYQGKKDCILVAEHPDYSLEIKRNERIIRAAKIDLIEKFPAENGWYLADSEHGIPFGDSIYSSKKIYSLNNDARYLWRIEKRVGLLARDFDFFYGVYGLGVYAIRRLSGRLGVAVEGPTGPR